RGTPPGSPSVRHRLRPWARPSVRRAACAVSARPGGRGSRPSGTARAAPVPRHHLRDAVLENRERRTTLRDSAQRRTFVTTPGLALGRGDAAPAGGRVVVGRRRGSPRLVLRRDGSVPLSCG